jgi:hypothetical protein
MVSFEEYEKIMEEKMTIKQAMNILGDRAEWEITHKRKALNITPLLLERDDIYRKKAINVITRNKSKVYR